MLEAHKFLKRDVFLVANSKGIMLDFTQGALDAKIVVFFYSFIVHEASPTPDVRIKRHSSCSLKTF